MKKKIIVIENDTDIRDIISFVLNGEGYSVFKAEATNNKDLHTYKADLILLDEWVNKREGHLLCLDIKEMHETKHIPVIILSTHPDIEEIAIKCKADGFIKKPFDLDELVQEVEKCLSVSATGGRL